MMRSANPATSMQKTYDECYLIASTAIYFEKQNNEDEALRSWREALDQIYYHNAYKIPANYRPKTETEKALQDSLRNLELQCKERVDLLDALRKSRLEARTRSPVLANGQGTKSHPPPPPYSESFIGSASEGLGHGTVPPFNYPDIARPVQLPKPSAFRPQNMARQVTEPTMSQSMLQSSHDGRRIASSSTLPVPGGDPQRVSRSPSPEKKGLLFKSTLRPGAKEGTKMASTMRPRPLPVAASAKAASLAWPGGMANGGSTNPSPSVSRKASMERGRAEPSSGMGPGRVPSNNYVRPPSATDALPYRRNQSLELPARPRSHEPQQGWPNNDMRARGMPPPSQPASKPQLRADVDAVLKAEKPDHLNSLPKPDFPTYRAEYPKPEPVNAHKVNGLLASIRNRKESDSGPPPSGSGESTSPRKSRTAVLRKAVGSASSSIMGQQQQQTKSPSSPSSPTSPKESDQAKRRSKTKQQVGEPMLAEIPVEDVGPPPGESMDWDARVKYLMKHLPRGVDEQAAKSIFNDIVIKGDEVHWDDVAGLDVAKNALKEAVVYPFLRPDLFMGLREPARGMLLFGPPGTGKTMLARAVATESKSTFFAISASSLTSKYLGESEKLVRALFSLAKALTPSIIFVDEIDSLLSSRGGGNEHEATRRIKTEFLIQWSDLAKAAAGREQTDGDASRVLVLAATNLPWAIDEAARRRFVRRQYIPLPEPLVRQSQLRKLMSAQKHELKDKDWGKLTSLTDNFSGSDITALAKDAAMGPLRSLGESLLRMSPDQIRPIMLKDFEASLVNIRPSVSKHGLKEYENWAKEFGERGG